MAKVVPHKLLQQLLEGDENTWSTFVFDVDKARALTPELENDKERAKAVLAAGGAWNCTGWNTSIASKKLWQSIRVPLVSSEGKEYLHAWLFGLSMVWAVEIPDLNLSDRAVLGPLLSQDPASAFAPECSGGGREGQEDLEEEHKGMKLDWEEVTSPLPKELAYLWNKAKAGDKLELRDVLNEVPRMAELPSQAPTNNHRVAQLDKQLRVAQQSVLHALRLFGYTYDLLQSDGNAELAKETFQKGWKQLADKNFKLEESRKEAAIPGSTTVDTNNLFDKTDMNQDLLHQKIKTFKQRGYCPAPQW